MKWSLWMTVVLSALCGCALRPPEETYCGLTSQAGITVRKPKGVSASDHLPTILFHHGIGANWVGTVFDAERAIANGYVAVMVNSRLSSTNTTTLPTGASEGHYWQAAREVQCLVRMLRDDAKHANKYNVDPNKVAFAGFSMGGILGYHLVTPSAAGREVAKEVAGLDPLASKYPNESGQPDAFIALSTALDPIAAGTGCLNVSRPFIARYEGTRAILHPWVRGAGTGRDSPYMCASNMSAADLASAPTRMDRTSTARGIVANAITARLSAYQGSTCSGKCDASCA
ncbi:MAG TPA: hypothetical protein VI299_11615, partial [Polyangiales bacterium]